MRVSLLFGYLGFCFLSLSIWAAVLVTETVGLVGDHVLTSREVQINSMLEKVLFDKKVRGADLDAPQVGSEDFAQEVQRSLLEWVVYLEAKSFAEARVDSSELEQAQNMVIKKIGGNSHWKKMKVNSGELRAQITRKLQAKKFINFKADSSVVPVTDQEAQRYFEENRSKFGAMPFENFKENIKTYLARQQVDRRLRDWFEVLRNKYKVRNLSSKM